MASTILLSLYRDEAGFIVSAEMVLIGTITVLGVIIGLTEVTFNVNQELEDVGAAFGSVNQAYSYNGNGGRSGSLYDDEWDQGDDSCDISCDVAPTPESY